MSEARGNKKRLVRNDFKKLRTFNVQLRMWNPGPFGFAQDRQAGNLFLAINPALNHGKSLFRCGTSEDK